MMPWRASLCRCSAFRASTGPEAFAFSQSSTTAIGDGAPFIKRLMNAYGTPNFVHALEVCGWGRSGATKLPRRNEAQS
jgi:hypothetical protein